MDTDNIEFNVLNFIKAMTFYQLAVTGEELFEYSIRKMNYFGSKVGIDEFMAVLPIDHIARAYYNKINIINDVEFMNMKRIAFIKMIIWEINSKITNWEFIQSDEDVEDLALQVTATDISDVEGFIKSNINVLNENCNRYKYYFALLFDHIVGQQQAIIANLLRNEYSLLEQYNFHDIYKLNEDEFFYQSAEGERAQYLELVRNKLSNL